MSFPSRHFASHVAWNSIEDHMFDLDFDKWRKTKVFNLVSPGSKKVTSSYDAFKAALLIEPINISFAVGNDFYNYKSGIYTGAQCET